MARQKSKKQKASVRDASAAKNSKQAQGKLRLALSKISQVEKTWKQKLAAQAKEFQQKLKEAEQAAFEKATQDLLAEQDKKEQARAKAMASAESKFEKLYTKKNKKTKKAKKSKSTDLKAKSAKSDAPKEKSAPKKQAAAKSSKGKRGRPSKQAMQMNNGSVNHSANEQNNAGDQE